MRGGHAGCCSAVCRQSECVRKCVCEILTQSRSPSLSRTVSLSLSRTVSLQGGMGRRYYCDYCDRSFQDTLHNRRKHLTGVQHQRSRKAWLDRFRDAAAVLQEERSKQPCRKFLQTGQCIYGPSCRYSHFSEKDMIALEQQIEDERCQKMGPEHDEASEPSIEEWLSRREKKRTTLAAGSVLKPEEEEAAESNEVPPFLLSVPDLPPSLLPLKLRGRMETVHSDWG